MINHLILYEKCIKFDCNSFVLHATVSLVPILEFGDEIGKDSMVKILLH